MSQDHNAVFLSYASEDAEAALRICEALRAAGIEVWFDQSELRGGDAWDRKIRTQIRDCALFIPVISAHSEARLEGYFRREWKWAVDRTQDMADQKPFLVPVVIDGTAEPGASTPEKFHEVQWMRLPNGATSSAFIERVARLLSPNEPLAQTSTGNTEREGREAGGISKALTTNPGALRRLPVALMLLTVCGVFAIGYLLIDRLVLSKHPAETGRVPASATPSVPAVQTAVSDKSIAVLPFVDMSEKHDQEYFSDGLAEELLDLLAKTPGLRVIARTSSFYFKGKQVPLAEIAKTLSVATLLEGSVRKSGNHLRVTTQLIRADTGEHLWSETYDRDLKDIFQVQDDIADAVVKALKTTLLAKSSAGDRTANMEAYALLLEGKYLIGHQSQSDLQQAAQVLQRAVALDPTYGGAWAQLAKAHLLLTHWVDATPEERNRDVEQSRTAVRRALELEPDSTAAHVVLADLKAGYDLDWNGAAEELAAAHRSDPTLNLVAARTSTFMGTCIAGPCYEGKIKDISDEINHDPLNAMAYRRRAWMRYVGGELAEAESDGRHALALNPDLAVGHFALVQVLIDRHKFADALAVAQSDQTVFRPGSLAMAYYALGRRTEADAALHDLLSNPFNFNVIAKVYAVRGDMASALDWLERLTQSPLSGGGWIEYVATDPEFRPMAHDPRFIALMKKMNLSN